MSKIFLDSNELEERERIALEEAFSEAFESDMPAVLELMYVSAEEIRSLNARERGVDAVTDVLSFPAMELVPGEQILSDEHGECVETVVDEGEECERIYLGSVVICKQRAAKQAEEYGHSQARELCYLAAHGLLHCLGYDHMVEEDKKIMREKEEEIMRRLHLERES